MYVPVCVMSNAQGMKYWLPKLLHWTLDDAEDTCCCWWCDDVMMMMMMMVVVVVVVLVQVRVRCMQSTQTYVQTLLYTQPRAITVHVHIHYKIVILHTVLTTFCVWNCGPANLEVLFEPRIWQISPGVWAEQRVNAGIRLVQDGLGQRSNLTCRPSVRLFIEFEPTCLLEPSQDLISSLPVFQSPDVCVQIQSHGSWFVQ